MKKKTENSVCNNEDISAARNPIVHSISFLVCFFFILSSLFGLFSAVLLLFVARAVRARITCVRMLSNEKRKRKWKKIRTTNEIEFSFLLGSTTSTTICNVYVERVYIEYAVDFIHMQNPTNDFFWILFFLFHCRLRSFPSLCHAVHVCAKRSVLYVNEYFWFAVSLEPRDAASIGEHNRIEETWSYADARWNNKQQRKRHRITDNELCTSSDAHTRTGRQFRSTLNIPWGTHTNVRAPLAPAWHHWRSRFNGKIHHWAAAHWCGYSGSV